MRESDIEQQLREYAEGRGYLVYKFTSPNKRGVPDRLFISPNGVHLFLEVKRPGETPTALQNRQIRLINKNKGHAYWVDNFEEGKRLIDLHL